MIGGIYSDQKCPICGRTFKDDGRRACICPDHPKQRATQFKVKFLTTYRRFNDYDSAHRFLVSLQVKFEDKQYDPRDYQKDNPLGFESQAQLYLEHRKSDLISWRHVKHHLTLAIQYFGQKNIKEIGFAELDDFLGAHTDRAKKILGHLSDKSRANIKATLHAFWTWMRRRRILRLDQMPEFPEIAFQCALRRLVDKPTQTRILDEVKRITDPINPKIWIAIKWLRTYVAIRPKEMREIKEGDFNFEIGGVLIPHPKEKTPKFVPMLKEDLDLVRSFPTALSPDIYFFRHTAGKGRTAGDPFGDRLLWKYWKLACANLGIRGVDLYGGTKHSTVTALRANWTPEQIKKATMHSTNKAFERYFQIPLEDLRDIYTDAEKCQSGVSKNQVIDFKPKK